MDGFTLVLVLVGAVAALVAVRQMRAAEAAGEGEYKPIVIDRSEKRDARIPVTPISVNRQPTPVARTKPPSDPAIVIPSRARTSSSGPIDVALRLGGPLGAPLDIAIRPPLPEPEPVPADQIPVPPGSGLAIRTRTPTGAPMPSVAAALASPSAVKLRGRVSYALTSVAFTGNGLDVHREDGFAKVVTWSEVIGIVARRLPEVSPYDGAPFIDLVSTAGATVRLLPWTEITGHTLSVEPIDRMRSLVRLLAAQSRDAQLDAATMSFLQGTGKPAQLPDEKTLTAHDTKLR
jgi:hypothetical protein